MAARSLTREEETYLRRAALLSSSRDCQAPRSANPQRLAKLNQILARVQRVGVCVTQESFFKDSSQEFLAEIERRE
eukprot:CAMPEP_0174948446 /NCGR_PEP_ID=MMETSP1355-20121228/89058_1 /TAXON_ID=464990 /ORGANISM="Hemiselmis tepida, Strain CCMP443" /LENGTH=75 /DNA_ID=CAMNT_0016195957 /DNA_START=14 /DNA_END=241 /DNA_ORIENTATION=-